MFEEFEDITVTCPLCKKQHVQLRIFQDTHCGACRLKLDKKKTSKKTKVTK